MDVLPCGLVVVALETFGGINVGGEKDGMLVKIGARRASQVGSCGWLFRLVPSRGSLRCALPYDMCVKFMRILWFENAAVHGDF
jgi:hypothetical protein